MDSKRRLFREITTPIREGMSTQDLWSGPDHGLIYCWERGRQKRDEDPKLAALAEAGELVVLAWRGGVETAQKGEKFGWLNYLATWQGLRGDDLEILLDDDKVIKCGRTGQEVTFTSALTTEN
ncbi:hypothetical protein KOR42_48180 [Thalassoglobus neptunius]|uniref:Uncharacterized protein n=1 Tax=Thalassoglobus neptunius TaxID=1938619 RepID=A0A5C5VU67_9PLAN|nr:hypothetical protein [Thalassoglobus neptunius]TWT41465.1 hypothetical protein KOR42_48180 [Thalassoglobus neptunius]